MFSLICDFATTIVERQRRIIPIFYFMCVVVAKIAEMVVIAVMVVKAVMVVFVVIVEINIVKVIPLFSLML